MRTLKTYYPLSIHLILLLAGYLFINTGLAIENRLVNNPPDDNKTETIFELENPDYTKREYLPATLFSDDKKSGFSLTDEESELMNEDWTTHSEDNLWYDASTPDFEEEMTIEDWMTDLDYWNN